MGRLSGLCVCCVITERTRRHVPKDNPSIEIVTYTLVDYHNCRYFVDDFSPSKYHDIGNYVMIPVYIKPFHKRNGELSYSCICRRRWTPRAVRVGQWRRLNWTVASAKLDIDCGAVG